MSVIAGDVNGAVVHSNDDATDVYDEGTLDMITDADGEGDEDSRCVLVFVLSLSLYFPLLGSYRPSASCTSRIRPRRESFAFSSSYVRDVQSSSSDESFFGMFCVYNLFRAHPPHASLSKYPKLTTTPD